MKPKLVIFFLIFSNIVFCQTPKDRLLERDINQVVEELEFMYGYDQTIRKYTTYKTFDKSEIDKIELLPDSLIEKEQKKRTLNDSLKKLIFDEYINPKDTQHTEKLIEITKKYGFPTIERIKKFYKNDFTNKEFNPIIIFIHSPKTYWEQLKILMKSEFDEHNIDQCTYGYLMWHFNGRKSLQPMLENGWKIEEKDGKRKLTSTCK